MSVIERKWKVLILWNLRDATLRYPKIRGAVGDISDKMLAQQRQGLEADGLLHRTVYPVVPPKTEYEPTKEERRLLPALTAMQQWGLAYKEGEDEIACRG